MWCWLHYFFILMVLHRITSEWHVKSSVGWIVEKKHLWHAFVSQTTDGLVQSKTVETTRCFIHCLLFLLWLKSKEWLSCAAKSDNFRSQLRAQGIVVHSLFDRWRMFFFSLIITPHEEMWEYTVYYEPFSLCCRQGTSVWLNRLSKREWCSQWADVCFSFCQELHHYCLYWGFASQQSEPPTFPSLHLQPGSQRGHEDRSYSAQSAGQSRKCGI